MYSSRVSAKPTNKMPPKPERKSTNIMPTVDKSSWEKTYDTKSTDTDHETKSKNVRASSVITNKQVSRTSTVVTSHNTTIKLPHTRNSSIGSKDSTEKHVIEHDIKEGSLFGRFYEKYSHNLDSFLQENKNEKVQFIGNSRFNQVEVNDYLEEKHKGNIYNRFNPQYKKDMEDLQHAALDMEIGLDGKDFTQITNRSSTVFHEHHGQMDPNEEKELKRKYMEKKMEMMEKIELTPLPQKKLKKDTMDIITKEKFTKVERTAVQMRRFEYEFNLMKSRKTKITKVDHKKSFDRGDKSDTGDKSFNTYLHTNKSYSDLNKSIDREITESKSQTGFDKHHFFHVNSQVTFIQNKYREYKRRLIIKQFILINCVRRIQKNLRLLVERRRIMWIEYLSSLKMTRENFEQLGEKSYLRIIKTTQNLRGGFVLYNYKRIYILEQENNIKNSFDSPFKKFNNNYHHNSHRFSFAVSYSNSSKNAYANFSFSKKLSSQKKVAIMKNGGKINVFLGSIHIRRFKQDFKNKGKAYFTKLSYVREIPKAATFTKTEIYTPNNQQKYFIKKMKFGFSSEENILNEVSSQKTNNLINDKNIKFFCLFTTLGELYKRKIFTSKIETYKILKNIIYKKKIKIQFYEKFSHLLIRKEYKYIKSARKYFILKLLSMKETQENDKKIIINGGKENGIKKLISTLLKAKFYNNKNTLKEIKNYSIFVKNLLKFSNIEKIFIRCKKRVFIVYLKKIQSQKKLNHLFHKAYLNSILEKLKNLILVNRYKVIKGLFIFDSNLENNNKKNGFYKIFRYILCLYLSENKINFLTKMMDYNYSGFARFNNYLLENEKIKNSKEMGNQMKISTNENNKNTSRRNSQNTITINRISIFDYIEQNSKLIKGKFTEDELHRVLESRFEYVYEVKPKLEIIVKEKEPEIKKIPNTNETTTTKRMTVKTSILGLNNYNFISRNETHHISEMDDTMTKANIEKSSWNII